MVDAFCEVTLQCTVVPLPGRKWMSYSGYRDYLLKIPIRRTAALAVKGVKIADNVHGDKSQKVVALGDAAIRYSDASVRCGAGIRLEVRVNTEANLQVSINCDEPIKKGSRRSPLDTA